MLTKPYVLPLLHHSVKLGSNIARR